LVAWAISGGYFDGIGQHFAVWAIGHSWGTAADCADGRSGYCLGGVGQAVG
jgi:hypothetical protein